MTDAPNSEANTNDFYVGYLPLPTAHRRSLSFVIPAILLVLVGAGAIIAAAQRDPGPAVWDTTAPHQWTGTLIAHPYPMLLDDASGALIPVVEMGKLGSQERLTPLDATRIRLEGFALTRADRHIIELLDDDSAIHQLAAAATPPTLSINPHPITLTGEILDAKCYLGAMKPGDGRAHKACAELCIAGGIPPMLFTHDGGTGPGSGGAAPRHLILADAEGRSARDLVRGFLGEPVTVSGRLATLAGTEFLLIDEGAIHRSP